MDFQKSLLHCAHILTSTHHSCRFFYTLKCSQQMIMIVSIRTTVLVCVVETRGWTSAVLLLLEFHITTIKRHTLQADSKVHCNINVGCVATDVICWCYVVCWNLLYQLQTLYSTVVIYKEARHRIVKRASCTTLIPAIQHVADNPLGMDGVVCPWFIRYLLCVAVVRDECSDVALCQYKIKSCRIAFWRGFVSSIIED